MLVSNFPILKKKDGCFIQGASNILQYLQEAVSFMKHVKDYDYMFWVILLILSAIPCIKMFVDFHLPLWYRWL